MAQLGDWLMSWGRRLKKRYAPSGVVDVVSGAWEAAQQRHYGMEGGSSCC